jgi:hypothetical protein
MADSAYDFWPGVVDILRSCGLEGRQRGKCNIDQAEVRIMCIRGVHCEVGNPRREGDADEKKYQENMDAVNDGCMLGDDRIR